ncbi:MAG: hypothetical protein Q8L88_11115 [Bacteroidota bacterium]|nr:hypothetical protein [Bacteroidota bacterium]
MKKYSVLILLFVFTFNVFSQQKPIVKTQPVKPVEQPVVPSSKFVGMIFNDLSYVLQEPQTLNPSKGTSGANAFLFRRATIGYEYSYNKNVTGRIVYDASSNFMKQAFVDVRNITSLVDLKVGMMQTLSSEVTEKIWDYRSLEATVLDRKGFTDEFDMGLTITGRTNAQGTSYARLAVYNGNGLLAENDKVKKLALAVGNWFDKYSVLEAYVDYENLPGGKSTIDAKVFYGMMSSKMTLGAEAFYRLERKMAAGGKDANPVGASLYSWFEMDKGLRAVARVDVVDNDFNVSNAGYREIYLNVGIDYLPVPEVHLIPNLVYTKNLKKGTGTEIVDDMEVRLTTAVYFK